MKIGDILTILGLMFIALKLMGFITWSWWLILLPFYIGVPVLALLIIIRKIYEKANKAI